MTQANNITAETQQAIEAGRVLAYQRGYNDRMAGRVKFERMPHPHNATPLETGAYLQGWADGEKHVAALS